MANYNSDGRAAFDIGAALSTVFRMPGGRNFLIRLLLWGTAAITVIYALFGTKFFGAYGNFIISMSEMNAATPTPDQTAAMISQMMSLYGAMAIVGVLSWLAFIAVETAIHKNVFRATDHGAFPLRFGADELRVAVTQFVVGLCVLLVYVGCIILVAVVGGVLAAINSTIGGIFIGLAIIAAICALALVAVRWAPGAALAVRDGNFRIFGGWPATKGRFWWLFLTYLIIFIGGGVVIYIIMTVGGLVSFSGLDFTALLAGADDNAAETMAMMGEQIKSPRVMIPLVISVIIYAIATVLMNMMVWGVANYAAQLDGHDKDRTSKM